MSQAVVNPRYRKHLASYCTSQQDFGCLVDIYPHWEYELYSIHQHENHITNPRVVVCVCSGNQSNGEKVMRQDLPVIFTPLLELDDKDLQRPETPLGEGVGLGKSVNLPLRPVRPEFFHVEEIRRVIIDVL